MRVDTERLRALSEELAVRMDALEREAHEEAGGPFNLQSPKQIQAILFDPDRLGLPVRTKTPTGQPSTADAVLQELAREFTPCPASSSTTGPCRSSARPTRSRSGRA